MERNYKIVRFYSDESRPKRVQRGRYTLEEAQEHCRREDTHKEGVWFDGYTHIKNL